MNVHRPPMTDHAAVTANGPAEYVEPMPAEESGLDLRALLGKVWRGRWIIAVCVVVALAIAFLLVSQMRPVYRASSKVLFESQQSNVADLQSVLATEFSKDTLQNEIEILYSTNLIGRVVDTLGLEGNPEFNPRLAAGDVSFLDRLRSLLSWRTYISPSFLADLGIIDPPEPALVDPEAAAHRERLGVIGRVQQGLILQPVPGSRVIEIAFEAHSPQTTARVVNSVGKEYINGQLEAKVAATRQASEWLADRIDELRVRVENAELAVETARAELAKQSGQTSEITQQQLSAINGALAAAQAQRAQIEVQYQGLREALANAETDLGAITLLRQTPVIASLRQQEAELRGRESTLEALARDNPARIRLRTQLDSVREDIRSEARRVLSALSSDLELAREQEEALEEQVRALEATEQEQRRGEVQLRQLEREAQASRTLYESFLARLQETSQQESLLVADARILSPAEVPGGPLASTKNRVLMMSVILGGGLGVGIIFLLDRLNNTYRGVTELERATGLPVLASLPSIGSESSRQEVVRQLYERPNGSLAEAVRNLRTSVLFGGGGTPPRVIVFSSSTPKEGKSTSSLLLALTSQQMGRSAIIVDCDLRLHALSNLVGQEDGKRPGLLSVLDGTASLEDAVYVDPETGLRILATQPGENAKGVSAADIVASQKFGNLIDILTRTYDLVVLDTPPVLVVTDARVIARRADAVVYAVRWDVTPRGAVLEGLRELHSVGAPMAGLVLTMVDTTKLGSYAYEGYGYYRSRYHDYYS